MNSKKSWSNPIRYVLTLTELIRTESTLEAVDLSPKTDCSLERRDLQI